jgi:hypothetical protein
MDGGWADRGTADWTIWGGPAAGVASGKLGIWWTVGDGGATSASLDWNGAGPDMFNDTNSIDENPSRNNATFSFRGFVEKEIINELLMKQVTGKSGGPEFYLKRS